MMNRGLQLLLGVFGGIFFFGGTGFACQEIRFGDGQHFCFDIQKLATDRFQMTTSSRSLNSSEELHCSLKLPNNVEISLPRCEGSFNYAGSDGNVEVRADIHAYYCKVVDYYSFLNGRFGNPNPSSSSYFAEFYGMQTENASYGSDRYVSVNLRVKNTPYTTSYGYYNGNVRFRVEQYKNGRRETPSSYDYSLGTLQTSFSYYDNGEKRFDRILTLKTQGTFRLIAEIDGGSPTSIDINTPYSSDFVPEWITTSNVRPNQNERIDMTLRVRKQYSNDAYYGGVLFRVEKRNNGRWESASSWEYQLDRSSYDFYSSNYGEVQLRNFVKFTARGEFRVVAELSSSHASTYQIINVYDGNNPQYSHRLSISSVYPSSPRIDEWIDITVRALDSYGNVVPSYDGRIKIEVERYENGTWRNAYFSDYQLDRNTITFSSYDRGEKSLSDVVRFRTSGDFRIKVVDENRNYIYGTHEIRVGTASSFGYFTDNDLNRIRAVASIWYQVINTLENRYPSLRSNSYWRSLSNTFYQDMQDIINRNSSAKYKNWTDFYNGFQEWLRYTTRVR